MFLSLFCFAGCNNVETSVDDSTLKYPHLASTSELHVCRVGEACKPLKINLNPDDFISFSIKPSLPSGLSLNEETGILSGTPTKPSPQQEYKLTGKGIVINLKQTHYYYKFKILVNEKKSSSITCPTGYVLVPHHDAYTTTDFCVAKYEASGGSGPAQSVADGSTTPWVSVTRADAIEACQTNGPNYDLISNAQWQTIARNIESVASNWSSASVGSGALNQGNSSGSAAVAPSATDPSEGNYTWVATNRTHFLSNGNVIWDMSGNVREWVKDNNSYSGSTQTADISQITESVFINLFGPAGNHTSALNAPYAGLGHAYLNTDPSKAVVRGGSWSSNDYAGVFAVSLSNNPSYLDSATGFRCVYTLN